MAKAMKRIGAGLALYGLVTASTIIAAPVQAAEGGPVVAVFNIETQRVRLSASILGSLSDYWAAQIASSGAFRVVPRDQLKQRLGKQKIESYRVCYSQKCQIEIGQELAAQKSLAAQIMKIGKQCVVTATLYDLRKATTERAATVEGACTEEALMASLKTAAQKLTALPMEATPPVKDRAGGAQTPAEGSPDREATSLSLGPSEAKVQIEDFTDYQCPYCKRSHDVMMELLRRFPGKIRYTHRDFPLDSACNPRAKSSFHPVACLAAYYARCAARQEKFQRMDANLFQENTVLDEDGLEAAARRAGLDRKKLEPCLAQPRTRKEIQDDLRDGAARGVVGTPTAFVNGEKVTGLRTIEVWEEKVRALLEQP
jgi:protein-disulfide isomerase